MKMTLGESKEEKHKLIHSTLVLDDGDLEEYKTFCKDNGRSVSSRIRELIKEDMRKNGYGVIIPELLGEDANNKAFIPLWTDRILTAYEVVRNIDSSIIHGGSLEKMRTNIRSYEVGLESAENGLKKMTDNQRHSELVEKGARLKWRT
jgi:hypothetical protein